MWRTRCWGSARADNVKSNSPETEGEMYFCNARCLCIWAVQLATRPNSADGRKLPGVLMTQPTGERRTFADVGELAKWSVANALGDGKQA